MLSYHYYEPPDFSKTLNFNARMKDLERLKCGGFLTEMFTTGTGFEDMYQLFDLADQYKQSWHGWEYNRPNLLPSSMAFKSSYSPKPKKDQKDQIVKTKDGGHVKVSKGGSIQVTDTSRTYPQAVAGFTDSYKFDKDSKVFTLAYRTNAACKSGVTEIYFNKVMHYPDGFDHQLSPSEGITMSISDDGYRIILQHDKGMAANTTISFSMQPKAQTTTTKSPQKYQHQFTRPKTYQRYPFVPGHVRYPNYPQTNQGFSYYHHQTIDQHFPHYPQTNQHRYPVHPLLNYYLSYSKTNYHSINQH